VEEANAPAVVKLCRRLEGIPLAIELAAARVRVLPPGALLDRIGVRLDLLIGPSDLPERQRTLRATMDWSYNLLDEQERVLFAALSVFVAGFTLDGAQAVCGGEGTFDVLEGVSSLIEKSLVVRQERPDVEPRFRMLETVREYAEDRLEQSGKAQETKLPCITNVGVCTEPSSSVTSQLYKASRRLLAISREAAARSHLSTTASAVASSRSSDRNKLAMMRDPRPQFALTSPMTEAPPSLETSAPRP
jgi:predicted ATPase